MAINWSAIAQNAFQGAASAAGSSIASGMGSHLELKLNKWLNPEAYKLAMRRHLTGAEREQNDFNARQASLQREFAATMTANEWAREERLANTAMQRQVADMQAAGINPALMYQNGSGAGAETPSSSPMAGASASGSGNGAVNLSDMFALAKLGAETDLLRAQAFKVKKEGEGQEIDNANKPAYWNAQLALMGANKSEAEANISKLEQDVRTGAADEALKLANKKLTDAQITSTDLNNTILAYKAGMAAVDAKFYEALKSLDLALKSATVDKTEEEVKNLRKTRALIQAQIISEGAKTEMFKSQANLNDASARKIRKETSWIDAEEIEKLNNLDANSKMLRELAGKYDKESGILEDKWLFTAVEVVDDLVTSVK